MEIKKMFYSMGEVSEMFDVKPSLLRYWEGQFSELRPKKNKKGNRLFTPEDVETLKRIYHLVKERGMTLEGAKKSLRQDRGGAVSRDSELLERLQRVRALLEEVREDLKVGEDEVLVDEAVAAPAKRSGRRARPVAKAAPAAAPIAEEEAATSNPVEEGSSAEEVAPVTLAEVAPGEEPLAESSALEETAAPVEATTPAEEYAVEEEAPAEETPAEEESALAEEIPVEEEQPAETEQIAAESDAAEKYPIEEALAEEAVAPVGAVSTEENSAAPASEALFAEEPSAAEVPAESGETPMAETTTETPAPAERRPRRGRRSKGRDAVEKELFAFYEQSLFQNSNEN